ncbi:hypothetical protein RU99_GL001323 [Enterococcus casseliflavus]|nr:hypothetical protein RU99_GL001323 [Enterococcus casseliflavus]
MKLAMQQRVTSFIYQCFYLLRCLSILEAFRAGHKKKGPVE